MRLVEREPLHHLPLFPEELIEHGDLGPAEEAFDWYRQLLGPDEKTYFTDLSLIAPPKTILGLERASGSERAGLLSRFWVMQDPTHTMAVNERRVEHFRRVYQA